MTSEVKLIAPYGEYLVDLLPAEGEYDELKAHASTLPSLQIDERRLNDLELLALVGDERFVEVFVDTPLEVCEVRDPKGMYARSRRGEVKDFTGFDDPYEAPEHPGIVVNTQRTPSSKRSLDHRVPGRSGFRSRRGLNTSAGHAGLVL